jgi:LysM repeat protein
MNERDASERFDREYEKKNLGGGSQQADLPDPIVRAMETADRLSRADYSHESQIRDGLRHHLLFGEGLARPKKIPAHQIVWGAVSFAAGALLLLLMVAGLAWSIRNLIPSQGPAGSQISRQNAFGLETDTISNTQSTPTPMPVAALPAATEIVPSQPAVNGISYVVQAGDTLSEIAYQFGVSLDSLLQLNGLSAESTIYVGQVLTIGSPQPVALQPGRSICALVPVQTTRWWDRCLKASRWLPWDKAQMEIG